MSNRNNQNTADSLQRESRQLINGSKNAIRMGKQAKMDARKTINAIKKIKAGQGKAVLKGFLRSPFFIKMAVISVVSVLLVSILFMYALPNAVYTIVQLVFGQTIKEDYEKTLYAFGDVETGALMGTLLSGFHIVYEGMEAARESEDMQSFLSEFAKRMGGSNDPGEEDLYVTQSEDAEKTTLNRYLYMTAVKLDSRQQQIKACLNNHKSDIVDYCKEDFEEKYKGQTFVNSNGNTVEYKYKEANVIINTSSITTVQCATLLSLYSVQSGSSISNIHEMEYQQWLGYSSILEYLGNTITGGDDNVDFIVGDQVLIEGLPKWKGIFLPQYLYEQREYEVFFFGNGENKTLTDYYELYGTSAVDAYFVIKTTPFAEYKPKVAENGYVTYEITLNIGFRTAEEMAKIAGFMKNGE